MPDMFEEVATMNADAHEDIDEEEITTRADLADLQRPAADGDSETVRVRLSELQRLVLASVDPELDE